MASSWSTGPSAAVLVPAKSPFVTLRIGSPGQQGEGRYLWETLICPETHLIFFQRHMGHRKTVITFSHWQTGD